MGQRVLDDVPPSIFQLIQAGKGEALRIRAILRSLVPLDDLVGIISLPLQIPTLGKGAEGAGLGKEGRLERERVGPKGNPDPLPSWPTDGALVQPKMSASFVPDHKASMVLFLDRVYGIENQDFLLHVLDVGFLPDMRAAASLDTVSSPAPAEPPSPPPVREQDGQGHSGSASVCSGHVYIS